MRACWHNEQIKKDISDCVLTRVLYDNLVSLVYDTYTSHVKFTVQVTEGLEERLIASGSLPTSDQFRTLLDNDYWHNQILLTLNKFYLLPYDVVPLKWMLSREWFSERYLSDTFIFIIGSRTSSTFGSRCSFIVHPTRILGWRSLY